MYTEDMSEIVAARIVEVFPGDHDKRTSAVGFLDDDGEHLLFSVEDPAEIIAMAHRLARIAEVIAQNDVERTNSLIDRMKKSGAKTIGELYEMEQKKPKLTLVNGGAE